eukprot:gene16550-19574_t
MSPRPWPFAIALSAPTPPRVWATLGASLLRLRRLRRLQNDETAAGGLRAAFWGR